MRIGMGYDVHKLVENRKLILGGVEIPYEYGLLWTFRCGCCCSCNYGRVTGAAALGDIGKTFPILIHNIRIFQVLNY